MTTIKQKLLRAALVYALLSAPAQAAEPESTVVTIPAIASLGGVNGNEFQSDVWLFNRSSLVPASVQLRYRCLREWSCSVARKTLTLSPRQSVVLEDVVTTIFESPGTAGPLEISFETGTGPVSVTSRVVATSSVGVFGASVPALPASAARLKAVILGLASSGGDLRRGSRSNAGAYNPNPESVDVTFTLLDGQGEPFGSRSLSLAPLEAVQLSPNVFEAVGATSVETRNAVLEVTATAPVFSYATVIDNASGDAAFLTADATDDHDRGPLAGTWVGTFDPWDFIGCEGGTPATARFEQDGEKVVGVLDTRANGCGFQNGIFNGVLRGGELKGTASGGWLSDFGPAAVVGRVAGTTLYLDVEVPCPGALCIPGGRLTLHR
jgi:hypothetical protein